MSDIRTMLVAHLGAMRKYAMRLTRNFDDGEEVLQSACVLALQSTIDPSAIENQNAWFHRCVLNAFYAHAKLARTKKRFHQKVVLDFANPALDPFLAADGGQESALELKIVLHLIDGMPPRRREIMLLSALGFTLAEMVDIVGSSKQALQQSISRARRSIEAGMRYAA